MKMHNKIKFLLGLLCLFIVFILLQELFSTEERYFSLKIATEEVAVCVAFFFLSIVFFLSSYIKRANKKNASQQKQDFDILVELNASNLTNDIIFYVYLVILILLIVASLQFKIGTLLIAISLLTTLICIHFIINLITWVYYKRNLK